MKCACVYGFVPLQIFFSFCNLKNNTVYYFQQGEEQQQKERNSETWGRVRVQIQKRRRERRRMKMVSEMKGSKH
jgi:translation initiation factor 1 (eIF-1/SUI1)